MKFDKEEFISFMKGHSYITYNEEKVNIMWEKLLRQQDYDLLEDEEADNGEEEKLYNFVQDKIDEVADEYDSENEDSEDEEPTS